jgi:hypothetical protein
MALHAISLLRECLDYKSSVIFPPSLHLGVRLNNRPHIFEDIFLLSTLIMNREVARRQRFESSPDVDLRSTCYAYA